GPGAGARRWAAAPPSLATRCVSQTGDTLRAGLLGEDRARQLGDGALALVVVGQRLADRHLARARGRDAAAHELASVDQEPRAHALLQATRAQVADLLAEAGEREADLHRHPALVRDHLGFQLARRVVELDGDEALAGGGLPVLEGALVARVVRDDEQEVGMGLEQLALLVDGQQPPVVGERMDEDDRVLPRLDDLVEVADGPRPYRVGERTVDPDRLVALDQVAPDEIAARQVLVAGDRDQVAGNAVRRLAAQPVRHVLDEAGLAAARRPLQEHGQARGVGGREHGHLVPDREIVGFHGSTTIPGARLVQEPRGRCTQGPRRRGGGIEAEHAVSCVPSYPRLGNEPDEACDPVTDGAQPRRARRQSVVAGVTEDEEERGPAEQRPLREELLQDATEVRAGMEVERPTRRDVPVLDGHGAEMVDVGEEVDAAEVAGSGSEETEQELARRRDGSREVAEGDQVRAAGASGPEARLQGNAARRGRGTERAPYVEPAAARGALAAREPAAEAGSELAHEVA